MYRWILAVGILITSAANGAAETPCVMSADFRSDPFRMNWTLEPSSALGTAAAWTSGEIRTRGPRWQSPAFPVEPSSYYCLTVRSRGRARSMWAAVFFDAQGRQILARMLVGFLTPPGK